MKRSTLPFFAGQYRQERFGARTVFSPLPVMQAMHRTVANHTMLRVVVFLLLGDITHTELCCMKSGIGNT